jgi:Domain of unknown function (DUF4148)
MNSKLIATAVITLAALSSASAFAASNSQYAEPAEFARNSMTTSSVTRDQVRSEYLMARQNGALPAGQEFDVKPAYSASKLSRAQVKAEVMATDMTQLNKLYSNAM